VLTKAIPNDLELLFAWRRLLPANTTKSNFPTWPEHLAWFHGVNHHVYLIWYDGRRVGTVGADFKEDGTYISIHIAEPELRGLGLAFAACTELIDTLEQVGRRKCVAVVHHENLSSQALFRKLGFEREKEGLWQRWSKQLCL